MLNRLKHFFTRYFSTRYFSLLLSSLLVAGLATNHARAASETETSATSAATTEQTADPAASSAGAQKAAACATCHGTDGIAVLDLAPNLAGQKAMYTAIQLKAYRSGQRQHEVMGIIAKPLSDEDIDLLSEYYAGLGAQSSASAETEAEQGDDCKPEVKG